MDDYYRLLGVSPDAPRDEIRTAYKALRASLDERGGDADRVEASRVNRAWNVLSDPTQREGYDGRLARARAEGGVEILEGDGGGVTTHVGDGSTGAAERPRRRRLFEPADRSSPPARPSIELPPGMILAESRSRLWAMGIDFGGLLVIFVAALFYLAPALQEQRYPDEYDALDELDSESQAADEIADAADEKADKAQDAADEAEAAKADDASEKAAAAKDARKAAEGARDEADVISDEIYDVQAKMRGYAFLLQEATFALALAFLVVPSARNGQTVGKRLRGVRAVRATGDPLGLTGSLVRYGVIIFTLNALWFIAGPLAVALVLFGVLGWMRNPNRQGMHDRIAKTIVIAAD